MTDKMVRQRVRCNRLVKTIKAKRSKKIACQHIADNINKQLEHGWSPLYQSEDARLYTPISTLLDKYIAAREAEGARSTSMDSYRCAARKFKKWCEDNCQNLYSGTFKMQHAVMYLDYLKEEKNMSNRSYNNTIKVLRAMFSWAKAHCYCKENAFENCKNLKNEKKRRILIDPRSRELISEWCDNNSPQFGLVVRLVYSSAVRPREITGIQIKHIDLERHIVVIPEENAKNGKLRCATLSPALVEMIEKLDIGSIDKEWYLFGTGKGSYPGPEPVSQSRFRKRWDKIRKDLNLPSEMQLYSLRDTGIVDLLHSGVDQLSVQKHADHSSHSVQSIYTDHYDEHLSDTIYNSNTKF